MKRVFPQKTYYEIKEKLGEGLTSEVYRAFRVDQTAWTKQIVALKIIKSKKNVQILKREFDKLSRVQSKYCVQMKSWENLPQGSALVLEYIEGVTLHEMDEAGALTPELIDEIIFQIYLGLIGLHRVQVFHGDLNLKNVLINLEGTVKLIDFGFFNSEKENWLTPYFASPDVLSGARPSSKSDVVSLSKIKDYLYRKTWNGSNSSWSDNFEQSLKGKSTKASRRRSLANIVKNLRQKNNKGTLVIKNDSKKATSAGGHLFLSIFCFFLFCLLIPSKSFKAPEFGGLELRSREWSSLSINGMPALFSPIQLKQLRVGQYQLHIKTSLQSKERPLKVQNKKTFVLNLEDINLL